jgi:hypothetical protein
MTQYFIFLLCFIAIMIRILYYFNFNIFSAFHYIIKYSIVIHIMKSCLKVKMMNNISLTLLNLIRDVSIILSQFDTLIYIREFFFSFFDIHKMCMEYVCESLRVCSLWLVVIDRWLCTTPFMYSTRSIMVQLSLVCNFPPLSLSWCKHQSDVYYTPPYTT